MTPFRIFVSMLISKLLPALMYSTWMVENFPNRVGQASSAMQLYSLTYIHMGTRARRHWGYHAQFRLKQPFG